MSGRFIHAAVAAIAVIWTGSAGAQQLSLICTSAGVQYKVGEYACIPACHGQRRLARCDALSQSASWTYVSDACPSAMINTPWPSEWTQLPVATAMSPIPVTVNLSAPTPDIQLRITSYRTAYH